MDRTNGAGHVNHLFVAEDQALLRPPTEFTPEWFNAVQEEICAVIEPSEALDPNDNTQLRRAITKMIQTAQHAVVVDQATFAPAVVTGNAVYWDAVNSRYDQAIADGTEKQDAQGFADVANAKMYGFGSAQIFAGLTPGRYYLSATTAGAITTAPRPVMWSRLATIRAQPSCLLTSTPRQETLPPRVLTRTSPP